jgi:hypothetical protein
VLMSATTRSAWTLSLLVYPGIDMLLQDFCFLEISNPTPWVREAEAFPTLKFSNISFG